MPARWRDWLKNMTNKIIARYLENRLWPICQDSDGRKRSAGDNYGDIECPFCDHVLCVEGNELRLNDKCLRCKAEVVEFDERTVK